MRQRTRILGFDGSTTATGLAFVEYHHDPQVPCVVERRVLFAETFSPAPVKRAKGEKVSAFREMLYRVILIRRSIEQKLDTVLDIDTQPDLVAYEIPFTRGQANTHALLMALGNYLGIDALIGCREIMPIYPATVKKWQGTNLLQIAGNLPRALRDQQNQQMKAQGQARAKELFGGEYDNDTADALFVCEAAFQELTNPKPKKAKRPRSVTPKQPSAQKGTPNAFA